METYKYITLTSHYNGFTLKIRVSAAIYDEMLNYYNDNVAMTDCFGQPLDEQGKQRELFATFIADDLERNHEGREMRNITIYTARKIVNFFGKDSVEYFDKVDLF